MYKRQLSVTTTVIGLGLRTRTVPRGSRRRVRKAEAAILHPSGVPTTKRTLTATPSAIKKKELKQLAAHLADLRSTDQARLDNIGSAHLAQTSQPDPPTFGFSFSAMGASLVEAAASSTISGSTPANFSAKPAAPETPSLQLGSVPSETSQQNRRMPEGAFSAFMATTAALSAASFCSGDSTLTMLVDLSLIHI